MGERIVIQPNGGFARFSEIVDEFTHFEMTEAEVYEIYLGMATEDSKRLAAEKIKRAKENMGRWGEALGIMKNIHGEEKVAGFLEGYNDMCKGIGWYIPGYAGDFLIAIRCGPSTIKDEEEGIDGNTSTWLDEPFWQSIPNNEMMLRWEAEQELISRLSQCQESSFPFNENITLKEWREGVVASGYDSSVNYPEKEHLKWWFNINDIKEKIGGKLTCQETPKT